MGNKQRSDMEIFYGNVPGFFNQRKAFRGRTRDAKKLLYRLINSFFEKDIGCT
jgi:hypothetical protein